MIITTLLLVVALVLFLLAAFNTPSRVSLVALGLAIYILAELSPRGGILLH